MNGTDWADCIGLHHSESPLREAIEAIGGELEIRSSAPGKPVFAVIDQLYDGAGLELQFSDGRLSSVGFAVMTFPDALPAGVTSSGPIPGGFEPELQKAKGYVIFTRKLGGLEVRIFEDHGMRFHMDVITRADLDELGERPMSTSWTTIEAAVAEASAPPQSGLNFGYKTHWFTVQNAKPDHIREALNFPGKLEPCDARSGLDVIDPFISASQDGWRVVLDRGGWADTPDVGFSMAREASLLLDTKVCFFWSDRVVDCYAWSVFDHGQPVREWWTEDGTIQRDRGKLPDEPRHIDEDILLDVARRVSIARLPDQSGHVVRSSD